MDDRAHGVAAAPLLVLLLLAGLHLLNFLFEPATAPDRASGGGSPGRPPQLEGPAAGPGEPTAEPACLGRGSDRVELCGIAPSARPAIGGVAYDVMTVAGRRFQVTLPGSAGSDGAAVVVVPDLPIGWVGHHGGPRVRLTTATPADAAARSCGRPCALEVVRWGPLDGGAVVTHWRLGRARPGGDLVTVEMGVWTAVVEEVAPSIARFVAGVLEWRIEDGFLVLASSDPTYPLYEDWAGVRIEVSGRGSRYSLAVTPGCGLSGKRPDLGLADVGSGLRPSPDGMPGGEWCVRDRYWVRVRNQERPDLRRLRRLLEIRPLEGAADFARNSSG